jgi:tetratricopeptide (TPR) repeat protein
VIPGLRFLRRHASGVAVLAAVAATSVALGAATITRNREYASELSLAQSVLRHWPTDVAHGIVGSALAALHRDEEAIPELRLAARTDARSRYNLGVALYNVQRFDEAIAELERFAGENPMLDLVPSARRVLGDLYAYQKQWAQARNQYRLALSMIPGDAATTQKLVSVTNNLGLALAGSGRFTEAVVEFRRAVQLAPGDANARHNLAAALLDHGDAAGAEAEARLAIAANPLDAGSYGLLGRALALQGKLDEAIAQFKDGLKVAPGDPAIEDDLRQVLAAKTRR